MRLKVVILLLAAYQAIGTAQNYRAGQCIYTRAYNGLNLRAEATLTSTVQTKLAIGAEVEILELNEDQVDIGGDLGYWLRVRQGEKEGYIFSAFTQPEQIFYYGRFCSNWQNIINGLKLNNTVRDSTVENVAESESGRYQVKQYHYNNGMNQIEHIYNEKFETRYLIPTTVIDQSQVINLLLAVFDYCDCLTEVNEKEILSLSKKNQINAIQEFSSIYVSANKELISIKLEGGP